MFVLDGGLGHGSTVLSHAEKVVSIIEQSFASEVSDVTTRWHWMMNSVKDSANQAQWNPAATKPLASITLRAGKLESGGRSELPLSTLLSSQ